MNITWNQTGGILRSMNYAGQLKSTQDRMERQEKTQKQVDSLERQKENLKNVACGSIEEIAEKLKKFRSYEDQIASVKAAYNNEQMFHILDESTERGEMIAEAVEKRKPKTPEERLEDLAKEAMGVEDGGELEEIMDELEEVIQEMPEETLAEITEDEARQLAQEKMEADAAPVETASTAKTEYAGEDVLTGMELAESIIGKEL